MGTGIGDPPEDDAIRLDENHYYSWADSGYGIYWWHRRAADVPWCLGIIPITGRARPEATSWEMSSEDPLTLSPSLLCSCGDHGFIRDGGWAPA